MPTKPTKSPATGKTHAFQTEVQQLLHLIIHSLYSDKDIFLRELISNASDACDKLRFLTLTDKKLAAAQTKAKAKTKANAKTDNETEDPLGIWVSTDPKQNTITIRDNGIGMNHAEVMQNIGTIARSGTREFVERLSKQKPAKTTKGKPSPESEFIGQFGVGFYASFLVAKQVTLLTRRADEPANKGVQWTSDGNGEYQIQTLPRPAHGTEIILTLHPEHKEYLSPDRLRGIIRTYSDHISLPIHMPQEADPKSKDPAEPPTEPNWQPINHGSALWTRPKAKITPEEYHAFYTAQTYDPQPPAVTLHNRVEGKLEYISLFFIPAKAPFDLWDRERRHGIKLYVRRIYIADDAKQILPNYLRFIRGLIDSADLPLNVSREFLQQNKAIDTIRAGSVKKILAELSKIATNDPDKYATLWQEYGRVLKEGIIEDHANHEALGKLLRFASTHPHPQLAKKPTAKSTATEKSTEKPSTDSPADSPDSPPQRVSLDDYIARMPAKQKAIYYITAENHAAAQSSPHLEVFRQNDIEVLLLSDPVDEWVTAQLTTYQDKPLQSIAKGDLDLADLTGSEVIGKERVKEQDTQALQPLVDKIKAALNQKGERVKDVRISNRLVDSPACLVADAHDLGGNMERILKAIGQDAPTAKPILEINPKHPIITQLDPKSDSDLFSDWAIVLFEQAALAEGATLKDPGAYVKRINKLLSR